MSKSQTVLTMGNGLVAEQTTLSSTGLVEEAEHISEIAARNGRNSLAVVCVTSRYLFLIEKNIYT